MNKPMCTLKMPLTKKMWAQSKHKCLTTSTWEAKAGSKRRLPRGSHQPQIICSFSKLAFDMEPRSPSRRRKVRTIPACVAGTNRLKSAHAIDTKAGSNPERPEATDTMFKHRGQHRVPEAPRHIHT